MISKMHEDIRHIIGQYREEDRRGSKRSMDRKKTKDECMDQIVSLTLPIKKLIRILATHSQTLR
jgi:hypothetical protein